jgi:transposase
VAAGRCLAAAARAPLGEAQRGGSDRLVAGSDRQLARAGVWGGAKTGPSPVDRSRGGSKHHLIACGRDTPLAVSLTGGNRADITQMLPLVDTIPPVPGRRGRPRRRPAKLYGDRATARAEGGRELRRRGIQAKIARPKSPRGSGLDTKRWVVERTIAWLHQYRRLRIRYERRDDIHEAFLAMGCSLICLKLLNAQDSFLLGALRPVSGRARTRRTA